MGEKKKKTNCKMFGLSDMRQLRRKNPGGRTCLFVECVIPVFRSGGAYNLYCLYLNKPYSP